MTDTLLRIEQTYEAVDSLPLPLSVFVEKYNDKLPQVIAINESMYGVCDGAFTEGQLLKVYFFKKTQAVSAVISGANTVIPINSSLKLTIPYHPTSPPSTSIQAREGTTSSSYHVFATVGDLMKANPMPNVVYVGKSWKATGKEYSSINEGQVLLIKKIEGAKKKKRLLCVDVQRNKNLFLEEGCKANFTTQSSLAAFTLPTLLEHFKPPVNVFFQNNETCPSIALKPVTILQEITLQSIIASICDTTQGLSGKSVSTIPNGVVEIISTVSIDVRIVNLSQNDTMNFKITRDMLGRKLSPSLVTDVIFNATVTRSSSQLLQKQLLKSTELKEWKNDIIGIDESEYESVSLLEKHYEEMTPPVIPTTVDSTAVTTISTNQDKPPPIPPRSSRSNSVRENTPPPTLPKRQPKLRDRAMSESYESRKLPDPPSSPLLTNRSFNSTTSEPVSPQRLPKTSLLPKTQEESLFTPDDNLLKELRQSNAVLIERIHELERTITSSSRSSSQEDENRLITRKANKDIIDNYTVEEVVNLLEKMGLGKYGERFKEEGIDGDIFFQLDDSVLENDLGISTKLHRIRLMSIIDGRHSIKKLIT